MRKKKKKKGELRLSQISNELSKEKVLQLKMSIKKKENPKTDNKFDVFGKLGKSRSRMIVGNILKDVENKQEKKDLPNPKYSSKVELIMKKDTVDKNDFSRTLKEKKGNFVLLGDKKIIQGHNLLSKNFRPSDLNLRQENEEDDYKVFQTDSTPKNFSKSVIQENFTSSPNYDDDEKRKKTLNFLKN